MLEQERKEKKDKANDLDEKNWVDHGSFIQKNLVTGKLRTKAKPVGYVASDLAKLPITGVKSRLTISDDLDSRIPRDYINKIIAAHKKDMEDFIISRNPVDLSTPVRVPRVRHENAKEGQTRQLEKAFRHAHLYGPHSTFSRPINELCDQYLKSFTQNN